MSKIAIIGAGLAGLTIGLRLHQKNLDVEIYEARERVGGRVLTAQIKNASGGYSIAEVGGQNIADGGQEPYLTNLAAELGLKIKVEIERPSFIVYDRGKYKDWENLLPRTDWSAKVDSLSKTCRSIEELLNKLLQDKPLLKMALSTRLNAYNGLKVSEESIYNNIDILQCMLKGGTAPEHNVPNTDEHDMTYQTICGGNATMPLKIAEILDARIHLNKVLTQVTYEHEKIKLLFADNSAAYCDKLILAIPASVYQNVKFTFGLIPPVQLQKICSVKYGANNKALIPVSGSFSKNKLIITDKQISFFNDDYKIMVMYLNDDRGIEHFDQQLKILKNGYEGMKIPSKKLTQAIDRQFIKYDDIVTHSWSSDPFAKGSYSGYDVALSESLDYRIQYKGVEIKEIFKPVEDRIFFAGEHTSLLHAIATMNAAVESGERIARLF